MEVGIAELPQEEGISISRKLLLLRLGRPHAMAGIVVDAEEHGLAARSRGLQARGHFSSLRGIHARIIDAGSDQHRRVGRTVLDVVIGAHEVEALEAVLGFHGAELGHVGRTVGRGFHPQHVAGGDEIGSGGEQLRPLGDGAANGDAASATTTDREVYSPYSIWKT